MMCYQHKIEDFMLFFHEIARFHDEIIDFIMIFDETPPFGGVLSKIDDVPPPFGGGEIENYKLEIINF